MRYSGCMLLPSGHQFLLIAIVILVSRAVAAAGGDHHMHIYSKAGTDVWAAMCEAMEDDCNGGEPVPDEALPAQAAIRALDEATLGKGAILSLAYWFGMPEVADTRFNDPGLVRAENQFVANEVSRYPDRLVGFFSINPLSDYAVDEVRYWAEQGGLSGLKLHLANSAFEFGNADHMARLGAVIDVMNDHGMPVIIHLRNRDPDYGYEHAAMFIRQVARHAPAVTFQLAHMAGWGGYDEGTDSAAQAFLDAIESGDLARDRVWFDVAAVVEEEMSEPVLAMLRDRMRTIGFDRLLFASDWDEMEPERYTKTLRNHLGLSDEEMRQLLDNVAPYFR